MTKFVAAATFAVLAFAIAAPAMAQVAGTYSGTSADGSGVSYTVSTDSMTGNLALTSASIGFNAPCKGESVSNQSGWGFGLTSDIVNHKVTSDVYGGYFDFLVKLTFSANGKTAKGTIESIVPLLYPDSSKAKKALYCVSPTQTLSLTLQPATVSAKPRANASYLYDQKGRIIGTVAH